jgi:hypothetical protein
MLDNALGRFGTFVGGVRGLTEKTGGHETRLEWRKSAINLLLGIWALYIFLLKRKTACALALSIRNDRPKVVDRQLQFWSRVGVVTFNFKTPHFSIL